MKKNRWITLSLGIIIVLGLYAAPVFSQTQPAAQPAASQTPYFVAVVDVAQVMKAHPVFIQRQAVLKADIDKAEAQFIAKQEQIDNQRKGLETSPLKPQSPEYQASFEAITTAMADFDRDARTLQRRFALENAKIMFDAYQDIKATIGRYAIARGIAQVTDYRDFTPDPMNVSEVIEDMDRQLVWHNPQLNITKDIIKQLYLDRNMPMPALPMPAPQTVQAPSGQQSPTQIATPGVPLQR